MDEEPQSPYQPLDITVQTEKSTKGKLTRVRAGNSGLRIEFLGSGAIQHYTPDRAQAKVRGSEMKHAKIYAADPYELVQWWKEHKASHDLPTKIVGVTHESMHLFWKKLLGDSYEERPGFTATDGYPFVLKIDQLMQDQERVDKLREWSDLCKKSNYQVLP